MKTTTSRLKFSLNHMMAESRNGGMDYYKEFHPDRSESQGLAAKCERRCSSWACTKSSAPVAPNGARGCGNYDTPYGDIGDRNGFWADSNFDAAAKLTFGGLFFPFYAATCCSENCGHPLPNQPGVCFKPGFDPGADLIRIRSIEFQSVAHGVESGIYERLLNRFPEPKKTAKSVGVLGSVAGIETAMVLRWMGFNVTMYRKCRGMPEAIPSDHMPTFMYGIADNTLEAIGVNIEQADVGPNGVHDVSLANLLGRHDAFVAAPGCHTPWLPDNVPGVEKLLQALPLLKEIKRQIAAYGKDWSKYSGVAKKIIEMPENSTALVAGSRDTANDMARTIRFLTEGRVKVVIALRGELPESGGPQHRANVRSPYWWLMGDRDAAFHPSPNLGSLKEVEFSETEGFNVRFGGGSIQAKMAFAALGQSCDPSLFDGTDVQFNGGGKPVLVGGTGNQTNHGGLYVAGDIAERTETFAYIFKSGRNAGIAAGAYLGEEFDPLIFGRSMF